MLGTWWNALKTALTEWLATVVPISVTTAAATAAQTYSAGVTFAPGALPTDVFTITGSATKVVRVKKLIISGTSTAIGKEPISLVRRSTANTLGTSTAPAVVPHDTNNAAGTATVLAYTAPPTLGTLVGALSVAQLTEPAPGDANLVFPVPYMPAPESQSYTLRGITQVLAFNRDGSTLTGESLSCAVEWTESDT